VKYSRPPDLKSSSNVSLPFAWITGPATCLPDLCAQAQKFRISMKKASVPNQMISQLIVLHICSTSSIFSDLAMALLLATDYRHPERAFFSKMGRQIGLKFYDAFGGISGQTIITI
jgi:hypothetical protein